MLDQIKGLHHVTSMAKDARQNNRERRFDRRQNVEERRFDRRGRRVNHGVQVDVRGEQVDADLPVAERIGRLEKRMREHAKKLEFEEAAVLRDQIQELKELQIYAG